VLGRPGQETSAWLRPDHDYSTNVVACEYAVRAPLNFGSWSSQPPGAPVKSALTPGVWVTAAAQSTGRKPLMGIMHLLAGTTAPAKTGTSSPTFFVVLIVLFAAFYLLMIRPQRNRQRRTMQVQNQVSPGQRIRTTAGLYGTVVSGDDRDIVVEVAPGVHVTMLRRAVMDVLPDDYGTSDDDTAGDDEPAHDETGPADQVDFDHAYNLDDQPNGSAPRDKQVTDERETKDSSI
jgi:preprotein translocase subunit YajC